MTDHARLKTLENNHRQINADKGGWVVGEAVYNHGMNMMTELVGHHTWFETMLLNITGRLPEKRLAQWIEGFFVTISWPDPRIWCNHVGALAGSYRTDPVSAVTAGSLASASRLYGANVVKPCADFIIHATQLLNSGHSVDAVIDQQLTKNAKTARGKPAIPGYSRPVATGDERIPALRELARKLGLEEREHERNAFQIEARLLSQYQEAMNVGGYAAAFMTDYGYSPKEIYRLCALLVNSGVQACYAEYADKPSGSFLPEKCADIEYTGPAIRSLADIR